MVSAAARATIIPIVRQTTCGGLGNGGRRPRGRIVECPVRTRCARATARMPSPHPRDGPPPARPARCPRPPGRATNGGLCPVTLSTGPGEGARAVPGAGPVPISTDPVPARRRSPPGRGNQAQETENRKTTGQPSIVVPGPTTGPRTGPRPAADTGSDQTVPGRGGHRLGTDDGPSRPVTRPKKPIAPGQRPGIPVARGGVEPPTFRFSVGRSYQLSYLAVTDGFSSVRGDPDGT